MKDRAKRLELCEKSMKAFGVKYRWKRLLDNGKWWPMPDGSKRKIYLTLEQVEAILDEAIAQKEEALAARTANTTTAREEVRREQSGSDDDAPSGSGGDQ